VNSGTLDDKEVLGLAGLGIHVYKPNPAAMVNLDVSSLLHLAQFMLELTNFISKSCR
jgi:hypothetical protein